MSSEASAAASVADQVPALARQKLVFFLLADFEIV